MSSKEGSYLSWNGFDVAGNAESIQEVQRLVERCASLEEYLKHTIAGLSLRAAAQAVIDRWEEPLWKDVPATGQYINALRLALTKEPK